MTAFSTTGEQGDIIRRDHQPRARDFVAGNLRMENTFRVTEGDREGQLAPPMHRHDTTPRDVGSAVTDWTRLASLAAAFGLAAAFSVNNFPTADSAGSGRPPIASAPPAAALDPSRFMLNALLVPALDADAVPFLWVDPRPAIRCGPDATVHVNGKPLVAGALVPDTPFELEWQADGCRPFGAHGPRFDGRVKLTVFREDWGFSAMVEPSGLNVASAQNAISLIQPGTASLPHCGEADAMTGIGAHWSFPCR